MTFGHARSQSDSKFSDSQAKQKKKIQSEQLEALFNLHGPQLAAKISKLKILNLIKLFSLAKN